MVFKINLILNKNLIENYSSNSQKIRVLTESWTKENIFCSNCGNSLTPHKNNHSFGDFYCEKCKEDFELKSSKNKIPRKILGGEYHKYIEKIKKNEKPNLFLLSYLETLSINNFFVIPKYVLIDEIIEKRKPLSEKARRSGWTGCNILFFKIPEMAKIYYIKNGKIFSKNEILKNWEKTIFFRRIRKIENKGWILDILNCIESLKRKKFKLNDIYLFEKDLKKLHPKNNNIKAKIRQQLQFLRDKKIIRFMRRGEYEIKWKN